VSRRAEAALRVRGLHPPLPELFAALRAEVEGGALTSSAPAFPAADADESGFAAVNARTSTDEVDPLDDVLEATVAESDTTDAIDLALRFAFAAEDAVAQAARLGMRAAGDDGDADALDAVLAVLAPYASDVTAARAAGTAVPGLPFGIADRVRGVARSAGVVAATKARGATAVQRFGAPYCPRPECYGRNGAPLDDAWVAAHGLPPYGAGCNCVAAPLTTPPTGPPTT
jgi:hypothetical protein